MMKTTRINLLTLSVTLAFCFCLTSLVQAGPNDPVTESWAKNNLVNKKKAAKIPIWQITQEGTSTAVNWVNADNKRFAIYDPGTPGDETDDIVLDKETGLVWERSPEITEREWMLACYHCYGLELGNRKGWRTPTVEELASLVDYSKEELALPTGHPFINVQSEDYWSSSTYPLDPDDALFVAFDDGGVDNDGKDGVPHYVWCVRGGHGHDTD